MEMYSLLVLCAVLVGAWAASIRVQPQNMQGQPRTYANYNDYLKDKNKVYSINGLDAMKDIGNDKPKYHTLGDLGEVKQDLANGEIQKVLDRIPEVIERFPVKVRTIWQGEKNPSQDEAEFSVKNTVNIDAYSDDKSKLHLILDSKFRQNGDNIEVIDPSAQLHFQVKY